MFSGTVFKENCRKFQKHLWREVSAVFEDDYGYEDEELFADLCGKQTECDFLQPAVQE